VTLLINSKILDRRSWRYISMGYHSAIAIKLSFFRQKNLFNQKLSSIDGSWLSVKPVEGIRVSSLTSKLEVSNFASFI
jgi:hypothetical protein